MNYGANYGDKILVYFLSATVYNIVILKNDILTIKTLIIKKLIA